MNVLESVTKILPCCLHLPEAISVQALFLLVVYYSGSLRLSGLRVLVHVQVLSPALVKVFRGFFPFVLTLRPFEISKILLSASPISVVNICSSTCVCGAVPWGVLCTSVSTSHCNALLQSQHHYLWQSGWCVEGTRDF